MRNPRLRGPLGARHLFPIPVSLGGGFQLPMNPTLETSPVTATAPSCYKALAGKVHITDEERAEHARFRLKTRHYILESRFFVLLSAPVIWMCVVPILFTDIVGTLYQSICFPIYGIPKVHRRNYVALDRHHLSYLNFFEKLNCEYCAYVNGILAYFTEIAARTEQHWCPIKHAGCVKCAHSRYGKFVEFGDAKGYRENVEEIRRSYGDIEAAEAAGRE
jgi:hypothetical protein